MIKIQLFYRGLTPWLLFIIYRSCSLACPHSLWHFDNYTRIPSFRVSVQEFIGTYVRQYSPISRNFWPCAMSNSRRYYATQSSLSVLKFIRGLLFFWKCSLSIKCQIASRSKLLIFNGMTFRDFIQYSTWFYWRIRPR